MSKLRIIRFIAVTFTLVLVVMCQVGCGGPFGSIASARARADKAAVLRTGIGLRQIGPAWICFRSNGGMDEWITSKKSQAAEKVVQYHAAGTLLWEEDSYSSGRLQYWDDQTVEEQLVTHYDYGTKKAELHYIGNDPVIESLAASVVGASNIDVFDAAEKILKGWKMSRL